MPLGAGDLVLCSGTLRRGLAFRDRLAAAVAGGFSGLSLWGRDYRLARDEGHSDEDIRVLLADHGVSIAELDPAWWWLPGAAGVSIPAAADTEEVFCFGEEEMFAIAEAVGARSMNAVDVFGGGWGPEDAAEAFAALCDRAAEHGLLVHIEFLPWSRIPDVASAWRIVEMAGRANGGVAVDSWHFFRGRPDFEALRAVNGERIVAIQLDDGPAAPEANLVAATLHERLVPGEGDFDLTRLVSALRELGANAPWGVEVFNDELHAMSAVEAGRRTGEATRRLLGGR